MKYLILSILLYSQFCIAQNPCGSQEFRQFDFWLGDWEVFNPDGQIAGENQVIEKDDGCWLMENWTGTKGATGTSMNYFNPVDSTWNQVWLDNGGTRLFLKGRWNGEQMILEDEGGARGDENLINRIIWTPNDDGTVSQVWKIVNTINEKEFLLFQGLYRKKQK